MNAQELQIKFDQLLAITRESYDTFLTQSELALRAARPHILAVDEDAVDESKLALDMAIVAAAPIAAVPVHAEFAPLIENGHRFLLASDGLYLEVRRPWLHMIHRIAEQAAVRIPYGSLTAKTELAFGKLGTALPQMKEFAAYAQAEAPIEAAACLIWNSERRDWTIKYPETIGEASSERIQYKHVELEDGDSLAIDLHSHGYAGSYFSPEDDADDEGSVKIAGVFGNLNQPEPTVAFRMCVLGIYLPINVPAALIFG
jgi:PRTRC genetic system protein A